MHLPRAWIAVTLATLILTTIQAERLSPEEVARARSQLSAIREVLPESKPPRLEGEVAPKVRSWDVVGGQPLEGLEAGKRYVISFPGHMGADSDPVHVLGHLNSLSARFKDDNLEVVVVLWNTAEDTIFKESYLKNHRKYMAVAKSTPYPLGIRIVSGSEEIERAWFPPQSITRANTFVVDAGKIAWTGGLGYLDAEKLAAVLNGDYARSESIKRMEEAIKSEEWDEAEKTLGELLALIPDNDERRRARETYGKKIGEARGAAEVAKAQGEENERFHALLSLFQQALPAFGAAAERSDLDGMEEVAARFRSSIPAGMRTRMLPYTYVLDWGVLVGKGDAKGAHRLTEELLGVADETCAFANLMAVAQMNARPTTIKPDFRLVAKAAELAKKKYPGDSPGEDEEYRKCLGVLAYAHAKIGQREEAIRVGQELLEAARKWDPSSAAEVERFIEECKSGAPKGK